MHIHSGREYSTTTIRIALLSILLIILLASLSFLAEQAQAEWSLDEQLIRETIQTYFDLYYRSYSTLNVEDFGFLVEESTQGRTFFAFESDKRDIEVYHAKLHRLRYLNYEYFLDIVYISTLDKNTQTISVTVIEGHDVVYEISAPHVSSLRNLQHVFTMRKTGDVWKIIDDQYEDYFWRQIKSIDKPKKEIIQLIDDSYASWNAQIGNSSLMSDLETQTTFCTWGSYNRAGAIEYALEWATAEPPYNEKYYNFTDSGGDCTNFVSQVIHEGGTAAMVFGGEHKIHAPGWYYYNEDDWATDWIWVDGLYSFIVEPRELIGGPKGITVEDGNDACLADVIQYERTGDAVYDHAVVITDQIDDGYGNLFHLVSGHTPDEVDVPFNKYIINGVRFIHIESAGGYVTLPLIMNSNTVSQNRSQNPYPAPLDAVEAPQYSPYPAPLIP